MIPEVVKIFSTEEYYDAIWCVPPIGISAYVMILYIQLIYFEYYIGKTIYTMSATVAAAVLNLILNFICIPRFGYVAAAYTTLSCYILYAIFHYCVVRKLFSEELHSKCIYSVKWLICAIFAPTAIGLLIMTMYNIIWIVRWSLMAILGVYVLIEGTKFLKESSIKENRKNE